jgi:hypothetical protein
LLAEHQAMSKDPRKEALMRTWKAQKHLRNAAIHCRLLCGIAVGLVITGCGTQANHGIPDRPRPGATLTGATDGSRVEDQPARSAALTPPEQNQMVESVVRQVLDAHGFVPPFFIAGPDGVRWGISTRPGSDREVVMASVKMAPERKISVELMLYAHVGSTWALVGHLFRGVIDQEAKEMNKQIQERLVK